MPDDFLSRMWQRSAQKAEEAKAAREASQKPPEPAKIPEPVSPPPAEPAKPAELEDDPRYQEILRQVRGQHENKHGFDEDLIREIAQTKFKTLHRANWDRYVQEARSTAAKPVEPQRETSPAPEPPPFPEPTPTVPEPEPILNAPDEIEANINAAREKYVKAQQKYVDYSRIKSLLYKDLQGETQDTLEQALNQAKSEYLKLRAEFVGASVEKYVLEEAKLTAERFRLSQERKNARETDPKWFEKVIKLYDQAGNLNLEKLVRYKGNNRVAQTTLRAINVRTGVSLALMGVGFGFGAGSLLGFGALTSKRILGGTITSVGSYAYFSKKKEQWSRSQIDKVIKDPRSVGEIEDNIASLVAKKLLAGANEQELINDQQYKQLVEKQKELLEKQEISHGDSRERILAARAEREDERLRAKIKKEKNIQRGMKAGAVVTGALVGSGIAGHYLGKGFGKTFKFGKEFIQERIGGKTIPVTPSVEITDATSGGQVRPHIEPVTKAPEQQTTSPQPSPSPGEGVKPGETVKLEPQKDLSKTPLVAETKTPEEVAKLAAAEHPSPPPSPARGEGVGEVELRAGAKVETQADGSAVLSAGGRGIEGAMLDLKAKDPDRYNLMIKLLHKKYDSTTLGANNNDGAVVHRFVLKLAGEKGVMPEQLDRILEGKLTINPDGSLPFEKVNVTYMDQSTPSSSPPSHGGEMGVGQPSFSGEDINAVEGGEEHRENLLETTDLSPNPSPSPGEGGKPPVEIKTPAPSTEYRPIEEEVIGRETTTTTSPPPSPPEGGEGVAHETPSTSPPIRLQTRGEGEIDMQQIETGTPAAESAARSTPEVSKAGGARVPTLAEKLAGITEEARNEMIDQVLGGKMGINQFLKETLGAKEYPIFVKTALGLEPVQLEQVQNLTLEDFSKKYKKGSRAFRIIYDTLHDRVQEIFRTKPDADKMTIKNVAIALAAAWE